MMIFKLTSNIPSKKKFKSKSQSRSKKKNLRIMSLEKELPQTYSKESKLSKKGSLVRMTVKYFDAYLS